MCPEVCLPGLTARWRNIGVEFHDMDAWCVCVNNQKIIDGRLKEGSSREYLSWCRRRLLLFLLLLLVLISFQDKTTLASGLHFFLSFFFFSLFRRWATMQTNHFFLVEKICSKVDGRTDRRNCFMFLSLLKKKFSCCTVLTSYYGMKVLNIYT